MDQVQVMRGGDDGRPVVRLREVIPSDLLLFFLDQSDLLAARMADFAPRDEVAFRAHWSRVMTDPDMVVRTVLADDEVAGHIGSWIADGTPMVGYWITRSMWGRGIASRALAMFVELLPLPVLFARVAVSNTGSIKVLERCGFEPFGERVDELDYVLRRSD